MLRSPCTTAICGAALLAIVAASPAAAAPGALTFTGKPTIGAQTRVIDVREQGACEKASLPGARCLPADALFANDGRPVDFHTLRWLLGTIGLIGQERVVVAGADAGNAAAVGALIYLAGQHAVAVLDTPLAVPAKAEGGSARSFTREAVFVAPIRDRLLLAAADKATSVDITAGTPRARLARFASAAANTNAQPVRLRLAP